MQWSVNAFHRGSIHIFGVGVCGFAYGAYHGVWGVEHNGGLVRLVYISVGSAQIHWSEYLYGHSAADGAKGYGDKQKQGDALGQIVTSWGSGFNGAVAEVWFDVEYP